MVGNQGPAPRTASRGWRFQSQRRGDRCRHELGKLLTECLDAEPPEKAHHEVALHTEPEIARDENGVTRHGETSWGRVFFRQVGLCHRWTQGAATVWVDWGSASEQQRRGDLTLARALDILEKSGRSTHLTRGEVRNIGTFNGINPAMRIVLLNGIEPPISEKGDSGSTRYDVATSAAKGLHFGIDRHSKSRIALATLFPAVMTEMKLTWEVP